MPYLRRFSSVSLLIAAMLCAAAGVRADASENRSMATNILIEWTKTRDESPKSPDIVVFEDGRVELSERLGGGEHRLSAKQLEALRTFIFHEQQLAAIDERSVNREVEAAVTRRRSRSGLEAEYVGQRQMDSGKTLIRSNAGDRRYRLRYPDLLGDAQAYPEVEDLQRLRRIELRLLELVDSLSHP